MSTQIGYAFGMLLFVPLADILERRKLISFLLFAVTLFLIAVATAQNILWLDIASVLVGITTVVPQVIIPMVAHFADPAQRGKMIGTVMSGLLIGILLARTFAGFVGAAVGWRGMYWIAAGMMLLLLVLLRYLLPKDEPSSTLAYGQLLRSIGKLVAQEKTLREAALIGSMFFGGFSVFWTSLAFFLEGPSYHLGSQVAGLFGLVGVVGAMIAPIAGRLADKYQAKIMVGIAGVVTLLSFAFFGWFGQHFLGLSAGGYSLRYGCSGCPNPKSNENL